VNFSVSYSLYGACDILSDDYPSLLDNVLKAGIGYEYDQDLKPVLIGYDSETTTMVFFDFSHESIISDEPVVFEGDPGDLSLHPSFRDFLNCRHEANEITIMKLMDMRLA